MPVKSELKSVRLPKHITPQRYRITVKPDLEALTFTGSETIFLTLKKSSRSVILHAVGLKIRNPKISYLEGKKKIILPAAVKYHNKLESAILTFSEIVPDGKAEISLDFSGQVNERLQGLYRSSYIHKKKTQHIAVTQFEATDARRAFPCFDEPAHKAIFDVTMIVPKNFTAISNTLDKHTREHDGEFKVVKFAPTPKMSTYLLAFIAGELESIETKTKDGVVVRVFTTPGKSQQGRFALDVAKRTLEFLSNYFAIPYPLPVMDMIGIPDFAAGAMENWGAVTYRETALLVNDKTTPFVVRQRVAEVVAHELVHQWFGNLVTMEWWNDLWLNEGFASYMAYVVLDHLFPEWHIWTRFAVEMQSPAFELDSLSTTHPIEVKVHHPHEIAEVFDAISYDKGASILHMLHHYIGPEMFRDGLRYYLKKHSYKNTSTVHLWEAFEKVSGKLIRQFMRVWTEVPGYPFLTAAQFGSGLNFSQRKFSLADNKSKQLWPIPVQVEYSPEHRSEMKLLRSASRKIQLSVQRSYIKLNPEERAMYRVLYSPELLAQLLPAIENKQLDVLDRLSVIRDLFAFAPQGSISTTVIFEVLNSYRNEESFVIWSEISLGLQRIEMLLADTELLEPFRAYAAAIFAGLVKKHGWQFDHKDTHMRILLRALAISQAGHYGHRLTIKKAQQLFHSRMRGKLLHADLRVAIYPIAARYGDKQTFEAFLKLRDEARSSEEREHIERCLVLFRQKSLAQKALKYTLSGAVRTQTIIPALAGGFHNIEQRRLVLQFVLDQWPQLLKMFSGTHLFGRLIGQFGVFNDLVIETQLRRFFARTKTPGGERALKQAFEKMGIKRAWLVRDQRSLKAYFQKSRSVAK